MKGSSAEDELTAAAQVISKERGQVHGVLELGTEFLEQPVRVVRILKQ